MKKQLLLSLILWFWCVYVYAQTAVTEKLSATFETAKFDVLQVKSLKAGKASQAQLQTLNDNLKLFFFGKEVTDEQEKNQPTATKTVQEILAILTKACEATSKKYGTAMGLVNISYKEIYNENEILSIEFFSEYVSANSNYFTKYASFHLKTGKQITATELYSSPDIQKKAKQLLSQKIEARVKDFLKDKPKAEQDELLADMGKQNLDNVSFLIQKEGVMYYHEFMMPHVMYDNQPDTKYLLTWAELADLANKKGVLAPFYKK